MSSSVPGRWLHAVATAALSILFLAGCGSSGTPAATGGGSPAAGGSASASVPPSAGPGSGGGSGAAASAPSGGGGGGASGSSGPSASAGASSPVPPSSGLAILQSEYVAIVKKVNPSVVVIETGEGLGSGIVFDTRGDILTNAHVAGSDTSFTVTFADGHRSGGKLVGLFVPDDVAVIRVSGAADLHPATFGDSSRLQLGDIVLAIGNPLGLQSSVTDGIVSATGRVVSEPGGYSIPNMIQTTAAINPGNSGGALVDLDGEVVGIPTLNATDPFLGSAYPGIGFAVSSDMAADIARQLIDSGRVLNSHRAYLGVSLADAQDLGGALVSGVTPGGPAARAGIVAGDLIVSVNGKETPSQPDLSDAIAALQPGDVASVRVRTQAGVERTVQVTLGQFPGQH